MDQYDLVLPSAKKVGIDASEIVHDVACPNKSLCERGKSKKKIFVLYCNY